jgi:hypothetical protein
MSPTAPSRDTRREPRDDPASSRDDPASPPGAPGAPPDGILTATRGVHAPPELRPASGRRQRRFVWLILLAALLVVAVVGAFNAVVDPYGTVGTGVVGPAVWTDRSEKVRLIERLPVPPRVVVLGSSRAMKVQPSYLTKLTGLPAFNAAVSSGRPVDAYVFVRFLQERYPDTPRSYLWLLDQEAFADDIIDPTLLADPALSGYLPRETRWRGRAGDLTWLLSWSTLKLSWTTWREGRRDGARAEPAAAPEDRQGGPPPRFAADGFRESDAHTRAAARGRDLSKGIAQSQRIFVRRYRTGFPGLAGSPREFLVRSVEAMNARGATPVIVLSPVHPTLLRELDRYGWSERHRDVVAYLRSLQSSHDFVLLDMSRIDSFGGSPRAFYDGVHMTPSNYRRLMRTVMADPAAVAALEAPSRAPAAGGASDGGVEL